MPLPASRSLQRSVNPVRLLLVIGHLHLAIHAVASPASAPTCGAVQSAKTPPSAWPPSPECRGRSCNSTPTQPSPPEPSRRAIYHIRRLGRPGHQCRRCHPSNENGCPEENCLQSIPPVNLARPRRHPRRPLPRSGNLSVKSIHGQVSCIAGCGLPEVCGFSNISEH